MKVAITGTIGSGKTEVCNYLRNKGYFVFDSDKCNSILLEKGNLGYLSVKEAFPDVFDNDILNKQKLAKNVFSDDTSRKKLEDIMHPLILKEMLNEANKYDLFFAEVPLLFEANWDKYFDSTLLIVSDTNISNKRLLDRGFSQDDINNRINKQLSIEDKIKRADEIIYNNSSFSSLFEKVDKWLEKIC